MYLTWLDSNSWLVEMGEQRILVDPWLVGPLVFGNLPWLFKAERRQDRPIPESLDLILLSQGLADHAHPPTLAQLNRQIPVVASPAAAKVVESLGYSQIISLQHGQSYTLNHQLTIQATVGSPLGPQVVENGYLLTDRKTGETLYYEPHGYHQPELQAFAPVDVVITPLLDLNLLGFPFIKGGKSALEVVQWLKPRFVLPTAAGGDITFQGLLMQLIRGQGEIESFRRLLLDHQLDTEVMDVQPGDRLALPQAHFV
uniref:MBL fold metallo-hydrolase n=1 Tax=Cyanothece sp. (strain PCC 7425 / ATCC 29141) TaxID=395961 RepID=B8HSI9_CYAP4